MKFKKIKNNHIASANLSSIALVVIIIGAAAAVSNSNSNYTNQTAFDSTQLQDLGLKIEKFLDEMGITGYGSNEWYNVDDISHVICPGFKFSETVDENVVVGMGYSWAHYMIDDIYIVTDGKDEGGTPSLHLYGGGVGDEQGPEETTYMCLDERCGWVGTCPEGDQGEFGGEQLFCPICGGPVQEIEIPVELTEYYASFSVRLNDNIFADIVDGSGFYYEIQYTATAIILGENYDLSSVCVACGNYTEPVIEGVYNEDSVYIETESFYLPEGITDVLITFYIAPLEYGIVGDSNWDNNIVDIAVNLDELAGAGNHPPFVPRAPDGPTNPIIIEQDPSAVLPSIFFEMQYSEIIDDMYVVSEYRTISADPDGDMLHIRFDWDATDNVDASYEGNDPSEWSEYIPGVLPFESSTAIERMVTMTHTWDTPGTYLVRAQAEDIHGARSGWSLALEVNVTNTLYNDYIPYSLCASNHLNMDIEGIALFEPPYVPFYPGTGSGTSTATTSTGAGASPMSGSVLPQQLALFNILQQGSLEDGPGIPIICFPAGTKINMADGSLKNIEDIEIGDYVKSYNIKEKRAVATVVTHVKELIREGIYDINDGALRVTDDHPLFVIKADGKQTWVSVNPEKSERSYASVETCKLEIGDKLFNSEGKTIEVESIKYMPGKTVVYSFGVISRHHNFFADDYLAHNYQYVLTNDDKENSVGDSLSVADSLKINKIVQINADRLKEMLDIPNGIDINIKVYDNGVKILDYPEVSYDDAKTSKTSKNILIYHREPEYISRGLIEVTIFG